MSKPIYRPDPDGFFVPWKLSGQFGKEILQVKYNRLHNYSVGLHVRFSSHG